PWIAPENDGFDTRAFYAAKTWTDGERRYAFGWNPTREGEHDGGTWQWGGSLVVHEIVQQGDGTLLVKVPETVNAAWTSERPFSFTEALGRWELNGARAAAEAEDSFACAYAGILPTQCKLTVNVAFGANTRGCGIILRADEQLEQGYMIRLEPGRNRIVLDQWPRKGDVPYVVGMERPVELLPGTDYELRVFLDGSVCVVYVNDAIALSTRLYDFQKGGWGVFVSEGSASFQTRLLES
ncbi:glycoside hydrolase domain-containing protein, partial [Paenibacillus sp. MCAF20]